MDFLQDQIESLRLCLLKCLKKAEGEANSAVLEAYASRYGFGRFSSEQITQQIHYLASLSAVEVEDLDDILTVRLRRLGENHLVRKGPPLPGVARPRLA